MDRFVVKRPRSPKTQEGDAAEGHEKGDPKLPRAEHGVAGTAIALTRPVSGIMELEQQAVDLFQEYPLDAWYNLGDYLPNRQLLFGPCEGAHHRTPHETTIPPVLLEIFSRARAALLDECPEFCSRGGVPIPERCTGCAINRYARTENGRGNGLGPHRDKGSWQPLVIGVTLVESREMEFTDDYKERATHTVRLTTERASVYGFRDELYRRWFHASLKKGRSQAKTIYSITYRFSEEVS